MLTIIGLGFGEQGEWGRVLLALVSANWLKSLLRYLMCALGAATGRHRHGASMPSGHGSTSTVKAAGRYYGAAMRLWTTPSCDRQRRKRVIRITAA